MDKQLREYRGIKIADSVKLYKKDGSYNKGTITALDSLVDILTKRKHTLIGVYSKGSDLITIDAHCGHPPYKIIANLYKSSKADYTREGNFCSICTKITTEKNRAPEAAKQQFFDILEQRGDTLLSEYINSETHVLIQMCAEHQPVRITPSLYKNGRGCKLCKNTCKEQAEEEAFRLLVESNGHKVVGTYINARTPILVDMGCKHGAVPVYSSSYKAGRRCRFCKESRGERIVYEWLTEKNINFNREHIFKDLPKKRYDFFIPAFNVVIEIHGRQHFEEDKDWVASDLKEIQKNDKLKKTFVINRGINYIMVDYRESDPELCLSRFKTQFKAYLIEHGYWKKD